MQNNTYRSPNMNPALFVVLGSQKEGLSMEWGQILIIGHLRTTSKDPNRGLHKT